MTLVELALVLGIVSVMVAVAAPSMINWQRNQRVKAAARDLGDLLLLARAEATRTGERHVLLFGPPGTSDPSGTVVAVGGEWVPVMAFADGAPGAADCSLGAGEAREVLRPVDDVEWGVSLATVAAPNDPRAAFFAAPQASGSTFRNPANNPTSWFLFRPDGVPVPFQGQLGSCGTVGTTAQGGGAFYLTNGTRDYAVVLSPMGGVRVHVWSETAGAWRP